MSIMWILLSLTLSVGLFIAARMNGFKRTHQEIVLIVKICEATLRKRFALHRTKNRITISVTLLNDIYLILDSKSSR